MRKRQGFSLIELLIVVAIILIIAAIAIPNLIKSRIQANEASAVASLRDLNIAQETYNAEYPTIGYSCTLSYLAGSGTPGSSNAGILDTALSTGVKSGYSFSVSGCVAPAGPVVYYSTDAAPLVKSMTGIRYFCSDQTGRINYGSTYPCSFPL
jgi:type IV pilus assembly protein PilA